jgi:hypothetical protein
MCSPGAAILPPHLEHLIDGIIYRQEGRNGGALCLAIQTAISQTAIFRPITA